MTHEKSLSGLIIDAVNDLNQLKELRQLLDVALDKVPDKITLLVDTYQTMSEPHLDGLDRTLNEILEVLIGNDAVK